MGRRPCGCGAADGGPCKRRPCFVASFFVRAMACGRVVGAAYKGNVIYQGFWCPAGRRATTGRDRAAGIGIGPCRRTPSVFWTCGAGIRVECATFPIVPKPPQENTVAAIAMIPGMHSDLIYTERREARYRAPGGRLDRAFNAYFGLLLPILPRAYREAGTRRVPRPSRAPCASGRSGFLDEIRGYARAG